MASAHRAAAEHWLGSPALSHREVPALSQFLRPTSSARFDGLVAEHLESVWRVLRRFGLSSSDAEDAAQEVFLVLSRRLADVAPGSERAFLFATARRVASTRRRSVRRRPEDASDRIEDHSTDAPNPEESHGLAQARVLLDGILDAMDDDARVVFVLYEVERMSGPAIAELLELPMGTVNTRLRRAREAFASAAERLRVRDGFRVRSS